MSWKDKREKVFVAESTKSWRTKVSKASEEFAELGLIEFGSVMIHSFLSGSTNWLFPFRVFSTELLNVGSESY